MFKTTGGPEKKTDNLYHLAHMVALLGPPPVELLQRSTMDADELGQYFDERGKPFTIYFTARVKLCLFILWTD